MYENITTGELVNTLKGKYEWKLSRIDITPKFWYNHLSSTHQNMMNPILEISKEPEKYRIGSQKK